MKHHTTAQFWRHLDRLPAHIQKLARENYALLRENPRHPSLHFKKAGKYWSARVGIEYRAAGIDGGNVVIWFWIGHHKVYDRLLEQ